MDMNKLVTCKFCNDKGLYGKMIWKDGRQMCRKCYETYINKKK